MSDAIREAFEAWTENFDHDANEWEDMGRDDVFAAGYRAALQSQTAPAVPEELTDLLNRISPPMRGQAIKGDPTELRHTGHDVYLAQRVKAWLAAAPQPDHIGDAGKVDGVDRWPGSITRSQAIKILDRATDKDDPHWEFVVDDFYDEASDTMPSIFHVFAAIGVTEEEYRKATGVQNIDWPASATPSVPEEDTGKVVQGEPVAFGYVDPNVYNKGSVGGGISKTPTDTRALAVYTHPAESREEIQAQALESAWDKLYDMAEDMRNDDPAEASGIMTATEYLREEFTRLRATQQEDNTAGDDGEGA